MALAITNLTSGSSATNGATTASIAVPNNSVAYVSPALAMDSGSVVTALTVSLGTLSNVTLTEVQGRVNYGTRRWVSMWRVVNTSGSEQSGTLTITASWSSGLFNELMWVIDSVTDIDTTTPNGAMASNAGTGTSGTVTVSGTPDAGDFVYGVFVHTGASSNMTINAELSNEVLEIGGGTNVRRMLTAYDSTPDSSPVPGVSWSGTEDWGAIAFILNVAAGGGGTPVAVFSYHYGQQGIQ